MPGLDRREETATPAAHAPAPPPRGKSLLTIALEVTLITVGVFLALMGDEWREHMQHRQLADAALRHFRAEFITNRDAVAAVRDRHVEGLQAMQQWFRAAAKARLQLPQPFESTYPAFLEYTAWDLALATQSLAWVDTDLAHAISHVYTVQRQLDNATNIITGVLYSKPMSDNVPSFLASMSIYFSDCTLIEPRLLKLYDDIIPRLDQVLGDARADRSSSH